MQFNNDKKGVTIVKTTKLYNDRIYFPKELRDLMKLKNGDKVIFGKNDKQQVVLLKNEEEPEQKRFRVYDTKLS